MNKIPVGQTIARTYAFAFRHYFSNLSVAWLSVLIFSVVGYYVFLPAMTAMSEAMRDIAQQALQNPQAPYLPASLGESLRGLFLFYLVCLLITPLIAVGTTKVALQIPRGLSFVYLAIGKRELLVLGGLFTIIALYFGAVIVMAVVGGIVGVIVGIAMVGTSSGHTDSAEVAATTMRVVHIVVPLVYLLLSYFFVRLAFLMVPVTTAEGRFGVWRSWQLTKGNFLAQSWCHPRNVPAGHDCVLRDLVRGARAGNLPILVERADKSGTRRVQPCNHDAGSKPPSSVLWYLSVRCVAHQLWPDVRPVGVRLPCARRRRNARLARRPTVPAF